MRILLMAMLAVLITSGCTTLLRGGRLGPQPGAGVSDSFAQRWGCSEETINRQAADLKKEKSWTELYRPQVGWTACNLMAHNGAPNDWELHQSTYGSSASWWYRMADELALVTLEPYANGWKVSYVSW